MRGGGAGVRSGNTRLPTNILEQHPARTVRLAAGLLTIGLLAACASASKDPSNAQSTEPEGSGGTGKVVAGVAAGAGGGALTGIGYGLAGCLGTGPIAPFCMLVVAPITGAAGLVVGGVGGGIAVSRSNSRGGRSADLSDQAKLSNDFLAELSSVALR